MKKIITLISFFLFFACKTDTSTIRQYVNSSDRENKTFSITTFLRYHMNIILIVLFPILSIDTVIKDYLLKNN